MTNEVEITFEGDHIKVISNGEKTYESSSRLVNPDRRFLETIVASPVIAAEPHHRMG